MSIPYRTRRVLNFFGTIFLIVMLVGITAWLCWVIWLQRYVIYEDGGARLDFSRSANDIVGEVAQPPVAEESIRIYYNEGADTLNVVQEMAQLNGYYISEEHIKSTMDDIMIQIERLPAGTPVLIDLKGAFGSFFYSSQLGEAVISQSTDIEAVDKLMARLHEKGFYTIARISSLRDRSFVDNHVESGLRDSGGMFCWMDDDGMFWMDPTNAKALSWISDVVLELKGMGFSEVVLTDFKFPNTEQAVFRGDKDAALKDAAAKLMSTCGSENFTLSFQVDSAAFPLPEGRSRIYLSNISAAMLGAQAAQSGLEDPQIRLVFLAGTADTRYDEYSVLRTISISEEVERRKQDQ